MDICKIECFKIENFWNVDKSVNIIGVYVIYKQIAKLSDKLYNAYAM